MNLMCTVIICMLFAAIFIWLINYDHKILEMERKYEMLCKVFDSYFDITYGEDEKKKPVKDFIDELLDEE